MPKQKTAPVEPTVPEEDTVTEENPEEASLTPEEVISFPWRLIPTLSE